jgi:glycosyltransferase involved in cell wall biosynthesis
MKINIIAPDIWQKDAVGNFCLDLSNLLIENNMDVFLYAQNFSKEETPNVHNIDSFFIDIKNDDVIFLSYSIYDKYLEQILELPNKKICYFHGVTPAHLLEEFEPITAELCRKSVAQFPLLDKFDKVIANSVFIANDLKKYISKEIDVLPPVFPSRFLFNKKIEIVQKNKDFLVVGRVVPHKKVENAIKLFIKIKEIIPEANLIIIGSMPNHIYNEFLYDEVKNSNLSDCIELKGVVSDDELDNLYKYSYGFINASLHEGFCIPVLEALYYGLNIFVQEGHAAEELTNPSFKAIDFLSIDKLDLNKLLKENYMSDSSSYVKKLLNVNNIDNWMKLLLGEK